MFIRSEKTNGIGQKDIEATKKMELLSEEGFEKMMQENEFDELVTLGSDVAAML